MTPFDRLGRFVVAHARWVVGAWAVLLLLAIPLAPRVSGQLSAGGFILDDLESARAKALLGTELGVPPSALVVVFSSPDLQAGTPAFETAAAAAVTDIPSAPHVTRVVSHLLAPRQVSADRHTAYDIVFLDLPADDSPDALPILRERLHAAPGLEVEQDDVIGGVAVVRDLLRRQDVGYDTDHVGRRRDIAHRGRRRGLERGRPGLERRAAEDDDEGRRRRAELGLQERLRPGRFEVVEDEPAGAQHAWRPGGEGDRDEQQGRPGSDDPPRPARDEAAKSIEGGHGSGSPRS